MTKKSTTKPKVVKKATVEEKKTPGKSATYQGSLFIEPVSTEPSVPFVYIMP